jgi:hypothetical protein
MANDNEPTTATIDAPRRRGKYMPMMAIISSTREPESSNWLFGIVRWLSPVLSATKTSMALNIPASPQTANIHLLGRIAFNGPSFAADISLSRSRDQIN